MGGGQAGVNDFDNAAGGRTNAHIWADRIGTKDGTMISMEGGHVLPPTIILGISSFFEHPLHFL